MHRQKQLTENSYYIMAFKSAKVLLVEKQVVTKQLDNRLGNRHDDQLH